MAEVIRMPKMSDTMEEGVIAAWLKQVGDEVKAGDILAEVETDKATMELVARGSGILRKVFLPEGGTADVGVVIAAIADAEVADADIGALVVAESRVDGAVHIKRFQPKDRGRAHPILKRTCHITVGVEERA